MSLDKMLTLARLAVSASEGKLDESAIEIAQSYVRNTVAQGATEESALTDVAAIPIEYLREHIDEDGALENFSEMYAALALQESYCPVEAIVNYYEFMRLAHGTGGEGLTERMNKVFEDAMNVPGEGLRTTMLTTLLAFIVNTGAYMRHTEFAKKVLNAYESVPIEARREYLAASPDCLRNVGGRVHEA